MFGLDFLFGSALLALPAALLPVVLHLLFRRKSPVVMFSTLRFVKLSIQHTAARKRVQRWLLLACRVLLLLLLIWAVAQPVRKYATAWGGGASAGQNVVAVLVVDTSYSMQLQDDGVALLDKADAIVQDLLNGPLARGQVAVLRSASGTALGHTPAALMEQIQSVGEIQKNWRPLTPTSAREPLASRVAAAVTLLRQPAYRQAQKWLIVISDLQGREFPGEIQDFPARPGVAGAAAAGGSAGGGSERLVLFDLHPKEPRAAAIKAVGVVPEQPLPGIGSEGFVELSGQRGDWRFAGLSVSKVDNGAVADAPLLTKAPQRAGFEGGGAAKLNFPLLLPAERWMMLGGKLQQDEPLPWARGRDTLVETPPRRVVTFLDAPSSAGLIAPKVMRLALDPSEGKIPTWPLDVKRGTALSGREDAAVVPLTDWPPEADAQKLVDFARRGGTLVLALRPGLEQAWGKMPEAQRKLWEQLLPSAPFVSASASTRWAARVADPSDPLLAGLLSGNASFESITVHRLVPLTIASPAESSVVLDLAPQSSAAGGGSRGAGLLYRKRVGNAGGLAYTWATLPDPAFTNLAAHTRFLPMLVRTCLRPAEQSQQRNVELGNDLVLSGPAYAPFTRVTKGKPDRPLEVTLPPLAEGGKGAASPLAADRAIARVDEANQRVVFDGATRVGLYTWRDATAGTIVAYSNVQIPAAEAELIYRDANVVLGLSPGAPPGNKLVARSFEEFKNSVERFSEPEPQWQWPIAVVMFLLCLEALMGSLSKLWKPLSLRLVRSPRSLFAPAAGAA